MIEPRQIRAARALLNWSQGDLAKASGIAVSSIKNIENNITSARKDSLTQIHNAFENAGLEFLSNSGVRFKSSDVEVYEGKERFHDFTDFIYYYLAQNGGDVCISAVDEGLFRKYRKDFELYRQRMKDLVEGGRVTVRILATESTFTSSWAQYKWQPRQSSVQTSFYAFGNCLALISFDHDPAPYVVLLKAGPFAEAYRHAFEIAWEKAKAPPKKTEA
jgi:transcriptional regulator with XRE-family HTH domain